VSCVLLTFALHCLCISHCNTLCSVCSWFFTASLFCFSSYVSSISCLTSTFIGFLFKSCCVQNLSTTLPYSPRQKHNVPRWNKDVAEKHKASPQAYWYWMDDHKPKQASVLTVWRTVRKNSNINWEPVESPQRGKRAMPWRDFSTKFWPDIRKSKKSLLPSTVGRASGNEAVTGMWKKHFAALLNSSKTVKLAICQESKLTGKFLRNWWLDVQQL